MKRVRFLAIFLALCACVACRRQETPQPPIAKVSLTLDRTQAALGSPLELTYRFEVLPDAPQITENYRVFAGVVDSNLELMWTDDHDPPTPTTQWKPGQVIEYKRTVFIPIYPYIGQAAIHMGLYSARTQKRARLVGDDAGHQAYRVAKVQLLPQSANIFMVRKEGWHGPESPQGDAHVEWQWTKNAEATVAFKNPKADVLFYLDVDNPSTVFPQGQHVQVKLGDAVVDDFVVGPAGELTRRKVQLAAAQLGSNDMVELKIAADKTFVPALVPGSANKDPRVLGVRVFHAFVGLKN
jgi:hypothetical protein